MILWLNSELQIICILNFWKSLIFKGATALLKILTYRPYMSEHYLKQRCIINLSEKSSSFSSADFCQAELIWYRFVRRLAAYINFFKSLLLLHSLLNSFETRYTYFLGQSPNFVLFRILKFWFSDFLSIFIKIYWNCYSTFFNGFFWN